LVVDVPMGWHPSDSGTWPAELRFEAANSLSLGLPWGTRLSFAIPPRQKTIVIPPPGR
jgi:hypothetical protein